MITRLSVIDASLKSSDASISKMSVCIHKFSDKWKDITEQCVRPTAVFRKLGNDGDRPACGCGVLRT